MGHLQRSVTGHLLRCSDGHLMNVCDCAHVWEGCMCTRVQFQVACDITGCPATYPSFPNPTNCQDYTGTFTMSGNATRCIGSVTWNGGRNQIIVSFTQVPGDTSHMRVTAYQTFYNGVVDKTCCTGYVDVPVPATCDDISTPYVISITQDASNCAATFTISKV